jgi:hypothetical protein
MDLYYGCRINKTQGKKKAEQSENGKAKNEMYN